VYGSSENEYDDTEPIASFVSALARVSGDGRAVPETASVRYEFAGDTTTFSTL